MRLRIAVTILIDLTTGEAQSKATWQVEGQEIGLGPALAQATAALAKLTPPPPAGVASSHEMAVSADVTLGESPPRDHPAAKEARIMGGLLEIRSDVEQALGTRPAGRVLEVLKWIKARRNTSNIRSVSSLFWSLVVKD